MFCAVCVFDTKFDAFRLIYPVRGYCRHSRFFHSLTPHFKFYKPSAILVSIILLLEATSSIGLIFHTPTICQRKKSLCLVFITDVIFVIGTSLLTAVTFIYYKTEINQLNIWIQISQKWESCQLLFRTEDLRKLTIWKAFFCVIIFAGGVLGAVFIHTATTDFVPWYFFRRFVVSLCWLTEMYGVFEVTSHIWFVGVLFDNMKLSLEKVLSGSTGKTGRGCKPFVDLVVMINTAMELVSRHLKFGFIIWNLVSIVSLILNIYIFIRYPEYDLYIMGVLQARTLTTIVQVCMTYFTAEDNLQRKVFMNNCTFFLILLKAPTINCPRSFTMYLIY